MEKKILVTSALPYVNNVPHLGNIIGSVLSADVFARYCRSRGYDTLYVCGTDEHGTTTEAKAIEENSTPKQICDKYCALHKKVYKWFNCSFDCFGRTSNKVHQEVTQHLFKKLDENGYIKEDIVKQAFCNRCDKFLADRFIEGTCPYCGYDKARGDQCENCSKLLNAIELKDAKCKICGSTPVVKESKHLFLDLEKLQPKLEKWIKKREKEGFWVHNAITTTQNWIKEGLRPRAITRDIRWGVKVPKKGFEDKVFYVWFDAPIGYISITKGCREDWESWWKNDRVKLYQFMAKDNIPFHTILFPGTLMGADDEFNLLYHINSTEYLNYESGKFSKSLNQGVFGDDAMSTGIESDVWRYYLLSNRPETSDSIFSWGDFQKRNNNELLANLGNFVNRTLTFIDKYFDKKVGKIKPNGDDKKFLEDVNKKTDEITELMENVKLKDSLKEIMAISKLCNVYFQKNEPWQLIKNDKERCETVLGICAELVVKLGVMVEPFIPQTSENIFKQIDIEKLEWNNTKKQNIPEGHLIGSPKILFKKIEDKEIGGFKKKFSGVRVTKSEFKAESFSKVDLRAAGILSVEDHPEADKLYVLRINCGDERVLVAGLKGHYSKEELIGKRIAVVHNLKPAKLRGIESRGMLLAVEDKDKNVGLITTDAMPGEKVYVEGVDFDGTKEIDIKFFSELKLQARAGKVFYKDKELKVKGSKISVEKVKDGMVC